MTEVKKKVNGKKKGSRVELKVSKLLSARFKKDFFRSPSSGAIVGGSNYNKTKTMKDVSMETLSGDLICPEGFLYNIEIKARKDFNFWDFWNKGSELLKDWFPQVEFDAKKTNKLPMLIIVINRKEIFVMFKNCAINSKFKFNDYHIMTLKEMFELNDNIFFS